MVICDETYANHKCYQNYQLIRFFQEKKKNDGLWVLSHFSHVQLCAILWTVACQAPLSMGFSRQEYCSGLPCPPPGDLPDPGNKPTCLLSSALAGGSSTTTTAWEAK